jgi:hypothetical protein
MVVVVVSVGVAMAANMRLPLFHVVVRRGIWRDV